jgi:hypothetical protein
MLKINLDTVLWIVRSTREFHAKEEVVFPDDSLEGNDGDWAMQVLADHGSDMTVQELRMGVRGMEPAQQAELLALKWLGAATTAQTNGRRHGARRWRTGAPRSWTA